MRGDPIHANVLSCRLISNVAIALRAQLGLLEGEEAVGLITCDSDDVGYTALDEATKKADVRVAYAQSMYAGSANANTALAGEFLGILAAPTPEEARSGLDTASDFIRHGASFFNANDEGSIVYFAHCISRSGSYLSERNGLPQGAPIAYLIAPPLEAVYGIDSALKAANVTIATFYGPPSPTNFGGALLTGTQSDCMAACAAFAQAVQAVATYPCE